jgi:tRNA dimethylallyltransferase
MASGRKILAEIRERGKLPIVVGGTGLYLRALLEGLFRGPQRSEPLRHRLSSLAERKGTPHLHRLLSKVDPLGAGKIAANDRPKLIRALEVFFLTARPLSSQLLEGKEELQGFLQIKLGLTPPRAQLYEAINRRVDRMFQQGLVAEVQAILNQYGPVIKPLQSLGYAQVLQYLQGQVSFEDAMEFTRRQTRQYAKRQLTWFRREKEVCWYAGFGHDPEIREKAAARVEQHWTCQP